MKNIVLKTLLATLLLFAMGNLARAESAMFAQSAEKILFLGDSITNAGHYIDILECRLRRENPTRSFELINLGLPSETCSGLSEPDHPFPRPDLHERLDRALAKTKPEIVVACYGMNDGIYYPFNEERFTAYQRGINKLIEKVHASGAKLVLMTPPAFDPLPLKKTGKLRNINAEKFAWFAIYEGYDDVMAAYAKWITQQHERVELVIDLHTPVTRYVNQRRETNTAFTMSPDGVHLNPEGHRVLAAAILKAWGYDEIQQPDEKLLQLVTQQQAIMHAAWLSHVGHQRPGVKPGLPLEAARTKSEQIEKNIRRYFEAGGK